MNKKWFSFCLLLILTGTILCIAQQKIDASMQDVKGGCGSGPCLLLSRNCGYTYSGSTCAIAETGCVGTCSIRCEGSVPSKYCAGYIFRCNYTVVLCAERRRPICTYAAFGPPRCMCAGGEILGYCDRGECQ